MKCFYVLVVVLVTFQAQGFLPAFMEKDPQVFLLRLQEAREIETLRQRCQTQEREHHFPQSCIVLAHRQVLKFSSRRQWLQLWRELSIQCEKTVNVVMSVSYTHLTLPTKA